MREMSATLDLALQLAHRQESVELVQRRLHREKHREALSVFESTEEDEPSQANALRRYDSGRTERQIEVHQCGVTHGYKDGDDCGW